MQVGGSSSPPLAPFLQCFFSIFTIGSFLTASVLALFFFAYCSASISLILLIRSKKSSSEEKFPLKLVINVSGENPSNRVGMRRNSWPVKRS